MTPEDKVRTWLYMQARDAGDRELFDQIVHDDIVVDDEPVGLKLAGKEQVWPGFALTPEEKAGPQSVAFSVEFLGYVGDEQEGFARWSFRPKGTFAAVWGVHDLQIDEQDALDVDIAVRVRFKEGKIYRINEYWNPVPLMQSFGLNVPSPGVPA